MFKYATAVAVLSAVTSLPAQAAYIELSGVDVIYRIDADAPWLSTYGITPTVENNTLLFTATDGEAIHTVNLQGEGTHSGSFYASTPPQNPIQVFAKAGKKITGFNAQLDFVAYGQVVGFYPIYGNLSGTSAARTIPGASYGSFAAQQWGTLNNSLPDGAAHAVQIEPKPSFSNPFTLDESVNGPLDLYLSASASGYMGNSSHPDSFVQYSLNSFGVTMQIAPVPEPETYALMGLGLIGLVVARRRKRQH
ncbi:PEP-CTERM sorting domain-containing protein [Chitinolyticbacter albus]|uniref:PEP-CTERM sorting domain-containing protein n=1 Tax=Chitinolyticbacter albus TaxID=2961951 RepID=UPI002108D301|nr:PEP-CTERM sorting domain-containing protein [Chitinolyticbacter albus]